MLEEMSSKSNTWSNRRHHSGGNHSEGVSPSKISRLDEFNPNNDGTTRFKPKKNGHEEFKRLVRSINASQEKEPSLLFVRQFKELLANLSNYEDADAILELMFDVGYGIIHFLKSRSGQKCFDEPKEVSFSAMKDLLANKSVDSTLVLKHCVKLKDTINTIWRSPRESARLKCAALQCLISLVEHYAGLISAYDFDASDLYQKLITATESSKFPSSVKEDMFQLTGMIAYTYKDNVLHSQNQNQLIVHLLKNFKTEVQSTHKQINASVLAGLIRGLDYFLRAYGSQYTGKLAELEELLALVVNPKVSITYDASSDVAKKVKRRDFQRAALMLVEHNGTLLKNQLIPKYRQWFTDLTTWCRSSYREDSDRGKAALLAFLQVVAYGLLDNTLDQALRTNIISYLAGELVQIFETTDDGTPSHDVATDGIRLITSIALDTPLSDEISSELFVRVEKCLNEIRKVERGPGYVAELSLIEAETLLPNLAADEEVDLLAVLANVSDQYLGSLVTRLIQMVMESQSECLRMRYSSKIVSAIISVWAQLEYNFESDFLDRTLCDMTGLDADLVTTSHVLCQWWIDFMASRRKTIQEKLCFTKFVPFFGLSTDSEVRKMILGNIGVMSEKLLEQDQGAFLMLKLLTGVISVYQESSDKALFLKHFSAFFITLALSITKYHAENNDECLPPCHHYRATVKTQEVFEEFARNVSPEDLSPEAELSSALVLIEHMYAMIVSGGRDDPAAANLFCKTCLQPALMKLPMNHIEAFAERNIFSIVSHATKKWETESDLISKTTFLAIYETIALLTASRKEYLRTNLNEIYIRQLPVVPEKPAEIIRVILEIWMEIKRGEINADNENLRKRKIQYDFNAAALNAVLTILVAGSYSEKLVMVKVLEDYTGMRTWEKIIDVGAQIYFPVVKDITSEMSTDYGDTDGRITPFPLPRPGVGSAGNAANFDFTGDLNHSYSNESQHGGFLSSATKTGGYFLLQNHPCLDRIQKVIVYLQGVTNNTAEQPLWIRAILNKFTSANVQVNIKLFLCGVVLNSQDAFKPFGSSFMESIVKVLVAGSVRNHPTENSSSLNAFEREIIEMLLDWDVIGPEIASIEDLICYTIPKLMYKRKEIQQLNLDLLTKMTLTWVKTDFTTKTHEAILNRFEQHETSALQAVVAILKGRVLPCEEHDLRMFIGRVGESMSSSSMQDYELAAEGLGLLLEVCRQKGVSHFSQTVSHVRRFFLSERGRIQPFVMMLNAVAMNYPRILISFRDEIEHLIEHKPEVSVEANNLLQICDREEAEVGDLMEVET